MLTSNHSTSIEVPHGTTIKVPQARYVNQSTQWYFNGRTTHVAETCKGGCAKIYLISIINAIKSLIMYIQNVPNLFIFRYCPEFCVPHVCTMCEKHPDSIGILWEKFTNLLTCLWDVWIFPAEAVTSEEGNHQCQAIRRPYTKCLLDFLGGTHEKAK